MKVPDKIFCLIKFGSKSNLKRLLEHGELYFNLPQTYNGWSASELESGDINEGVEWIENTQIKKITVHHPKLGDFKFNAVHDKLSRITQYNYHFLSYSLYAISPPTFSKHNEFKIDKQVLNLKNVDAAVFIKEPYDFLTQVTSVLKERNVQFEANFVEYVDLEEKGEIELGPFRKNKNTFIKVNSE